MIVVAEPRCGATKFCIDLAEKNNLDFLGELYLESITGLEFLTHHKHPKSIAHETKTGNFFSIETMDLYTDEKKLFLLNQPVNTMGFDTSKFFIMRKNIRDTLLSYNNYLLTFGNINEDKINFALGLALFYTQHVFKISYMITKYCKHYNKNVLWYEDMEYCKPVNTEKLNMTPEFYKSQIYSLIDLLITNSDMEILRKELIESRT